MQDYDGGRLTTIDDDEMEEEEKRTIVYFDCFSGAAGDMLLASLFDAVRYVSVCGRRFRRNFNRARCMRERMVLM